MKKELQRNRKEENRQKTNYFNIDFEHNLCQSLNLGKDIIEKRDLIALILFSGAIYFLKFHKDMFRVEHQ